MIMCMSICVFLTNLNIRKLNAFFANVGGELQDYSMLENITEYLIPSVSMGLVRAELERVKTTKSCNSDNFPAWISK